MKTIIILWLGILSITIFPKKVVGMSSEANTTSYVTEASCSATTLEIPLFGYAR